MRWYGPQVDAARRARLVELVESVHQLPYGRPTDRSVRGMLRERRGTCSTKHAFLLDVLAAQLPETSPRLVHRVYEVTPALAAERFGPVAAAAVPSGGLVDVHRYLVVELDGDAVVIDATFPGPAFDGVTSMPLSCGPGVDHPSVADAAAEKADLERRFCDPAAREPFITALSSSTLEAQSRIANAAPLFPGLS
jgi:hypothetical protein